MTNQMFIEKVAAYVVKYAASYGIRVHSPIIAQAIAEKYGVPVESVKYSGYSFYIETEAKDDSQKKD